MGEKYNIILSSFLILTLFAAGSSLLLLPIQDAEASHIQFKWTYNNWTDVEVKITNSGSETARNMYVYVFWETDYDPDRVWEDKKYGPTSLSPGFTKTVTMYLDKPPLNEWTKFGVSVWGDNFDTVDSYGDWVKRTSTSTSNTTSTNWDQWCKNKYGSQSWYQSSTHTCKNTTSTNWDQWCKNKYGSNHYYQASTNTCEMKKTTTAQATNWDKWCKDNYGSNYYYKASTHTCAKGSTGTCGQYGWISVTTPSTGIASTIISIDSSIFYKSNASMKVAAGTHVVSFVQTTYSGAVKTWGPNYAYVDNCKPWTVRISE